MAAHTYANKGYYTDASPHIGGYVYEPQHVNWYVVETTMVERVRVPTIGYRYTQSGGVPKEHPQDYELTYGSEYENSSPPRHHERQNRMTNFHKKIQTGASRPEKTSNHSVTEKYHPTSPNKYRPTSPDKYRPTSPDKYRSTSPNKYSRTSPNKYSRTSPNKYHSTSPDKYHTTSLCKYHPTSSNKYPFTSPTPNHPSKEANLINAKTLPVPNKYHPTSQTKYQPTSQISSYSSKEDDSRAQNLPNPNKYRPTSPTRSFPSKEGKAINTQSLLAPNKEHPSSLRTEGGRQNFSNPNNHWQSKAPHATHHPLMNPTNDIDEALSLLAVSANYSPRSDPKREGAFDNIYPRARPVEHEGQFARPIFGVGTNRYEKSNMINSHEAIRRYNGAYVP